MISLVAKFHRKFGVPISSYPSIDDLEANKLRVDLLREELIELEAALEKGDVTETLDALTDLQYILDGTYLALGFARYKDAAFLEVHRSNMSKLGPDGQPIRRGDGKILKPDGWQPPDLTKVLSR